MKYIILFISFIIVFSNLGAAQDFECKVTSDNTIKLSNLIIEADSIYKSGNIYSAKNIAIGIDNYGNYVSLGKFNNNELIEFGYIADETTEQKDYTISFSLGINKTYVLSETLDIRTGQNGMTFLLKYTNKNSIDEIFYEFTAGFGTIISMSPPGSVGSARLCFISLPPLVPNEIGLRSALTLQDNVPSFSKIEIIKDTKFSIFKFPMEESIGFGMIVEKGTEITSTNEACYMTGTSRMNITLSPPSMPFLKVSINFLKIYIDSYLTENGLKGKVNQNIGIGDVFTFVSNNSEYNISFDPKLITSEGELSFNNNFLNLPSKKGKLIIDGDEPCIYFEEDGQKSDLFKFIK